jgi:ankyrin repeat protein
MHDSDIVGPIIGIDELNLHMECRNQCRSIIISKCIEQYPEILSTVDCEGYLPLHHLLWNGLSTIDDALIMIEKHPAALQHPENGLDQLPLHIECQKQCRSTIISKCIELYPESLAKADGQGCQPLHRLLWNEYPSHIDAVMMLMDKYPAALEHQEAFGHLPLHIECYNQCRSSIISKCIELYPEALAHADEWLDLPLHILLYNSCSIEDALMMIDKYPAALQHQNSSGHFPLHLECKHQCRSSIISRCVELYPEALTDKTIDIIVKKIMKSNFYLFLSALSIIFTASPSALYSYNVSETLDIRDHPHCRRRILHLLPRHVFTPTHHADYRDLNWYPRAAMMMLLSQIKIQQR